MSTYAEQDTDVALDTEEQVVLRWRHEQFRALGFGEEDAWLLAGSSADLQASRTLIEVGCPQHLALRILL